jgi:hypothetical protein
MPSGIILKVHAVGKKYAFNLLFIILFGKIRITILLHLKAKVDWCSSVNGF